MTASSPELISGTLQLSVWSSSPLSEERGLLNRRVDAFASAIRLRLFGDVSLETAVPLPPRVALLQGVQPPTWIRQVSVHRLPLGALRVLCGMLASFSEQSAPLLYYEAQRQGDIRNLFTVPVDYPRAQPKESLFAIEDKGYLNSPGVNARELAIRIQFREPPSAAFHEKLLRPFKDWDELLNGGYPPDGAEPGQSAVGPGSTRFIDPCTLEHHIEGLLAHPACFEPLLNVAQYWCQIGLPVALLELE